MLKICLAAWVILLATTAPSLAFADDASLTCVGLHAEWRNSQQWTRARIRSFGDRVPGECPQLAALVAERTRQLAEPASSKPANDRLDAGPAAQPPTPLPRPYPKQSSKVRYGIRVTLESLAENDKGYIASFRVENSNTEDIGIAIKTQSLDFVEALLSDSAGGSCQLWRNGNQWGSLKAFQYGMLGGTLEEWFQTVAAEGSARYTILFRKSFCANKLQARENLSFDGTLVILMHGSPRDLQFGFSDAPLF